MIVLKRILLMLYDEQLKESFPFSCPWLYVLLYLVTYKWYLTDHKEFLGLLNYEFASLYYLHR